MTDLDELERCMREGRQLLRRMVKYVREDRAVTPGTTRLERLTVAVDDYLKRTHRASDVLRNSAPPADEVAGLLVALHELRDTAAEYATQLGTNMQAALYQRADRIENHLKGKR